METGGRIQGKTRRDVEEIIELDRKIRSILVRPHEPLDSRGTVCDSADSVINAKTPESDYSQRIIGEWQGARHIRAFYPICTNDFGDDPNPELDRIIKLTKSDLVIEVVSERKDRGARYSYRRVRKPEI